MRGVTIEMSGWFGIDFGTTNSAAFSFMGIDINNIHPIHYGDEEGRPLPSVVAVNKETGEIITGRQAKEKHNSLIQTHEYFRSIKTIIDSDKTWDIAGEKYTAENIATLLFKSLKNRIEEDGVTKITEAVIAVPVGFSPLKKQHLRNAVEEAGIDVKMFMSEPTAAFCSNYEILKSCKNVAVFDWGGGTLDVVVLEISENSVKELSSEGMFVAGDYIDNKIAERIHSKFMRGKTNAVSFEKLDSNIKDRLLMECERAKCELETEDLVKINIFRYGDYGTLADNLDYDKFSLLIENNIESALSCLSKAIEKAGKSSLEIDKILCVGGSSKLRPLREKLNKIYGEECVFYPDNVMWDIAKGAAVASTRNGKFLLNKTIGLLLSTGEYLPLVEKGQPLPCKEMEFYFGIVDDSKKAHVIITDSENEIDRELVENIILPLCGYVDEAILIKCYIDEDFIFRMKIQSSKMPKENGIVWTYDKLKIGFVL
jgi:molecular chaperone DnaK